jgi:predicted nucleic-acid-binding protein
MIGIDTNVLIRFFIVDDDPDQAVRAKTLAATLSAGKPGYISTVTLAESVWVLQSLHRKQKNEIVEFIEVLLNSQQLVLENPEAVAQAVGRFKASGSGFTDCLTERLCHLAGCHHTVTFDKGASKAAGMVLL